MDNIDYLCAYSSELEDITILLKNDGTQTLENTFLGCSNLKILALYGTIGRNITLPSRVLHEIWLENTIYGLKNYKGTDDEHKYTITAPTEVWDRLEAYSTAPDGGLWKEYVVNTLGWNI